MYGFSQIQGTRPKKDGELWDKYVTNSQQESRPLRNNFCVQKWPFLLVSEYDTQTTPPWTSQLIDSISLGAVTVKIKPSLILNCKKKYIRQVKVNLKKEANLL